MVKAAKRAEIYDDIMEMPDQFDTYVGERGTRRSGGQKQRVSIARIILKDPKILILDEPTRGIDVGAKYEIYKMIHVLADQGMAVILVSSVQGRPCKPL